MMDNQEDKKLPTNVNNPAQEDDDKPDERDISAEEAFNRRVMSRENMTGKLPKEVAEQFALDKETFLKRVKESESFDIQAPYLVTISMDEPFFGSLSRRIEKIRTLTVPTAGVTARNGHLTMYWNPVFFKTVLSFRQVLGAIKHELYHLVFEHVTVRRQTPHTLWNIATDLAINSLLPPSELGEGWLVPGMVLRPPPNAPANWTPPPLFELIRKLPKQKSSEYYMNALLNDKDVQKAMQNAQQKSSGAGQKSPTGSPGGSPGGDDGEGGDSSGGDSEGGKNDKSSKGKSKQKQNSGSGGQDDSDPTEQKNDSASFNKHLRDELFEEQGGQFDDHDVWDEMTDEEKDMMRDYVRDVFRSAVSQAESRSDGWGSVPNEVRARIKEMISKEIDWRELVNRFIGRCKSSTTTSSIKRINRRFPWEHPGRKRAYSARPLIAFDQSGSMHDEWISLFFGELTNLGNVTEYDVLPFDHTVDEKNMQSIVRGSVPVVKRTRSGGTSFDAPIQFANDRPGKWDAMFILTDGGCVATLKCNIPIAYILAPGCEMYQTPPEDCIVIKLPKDAFNKK